MILNRFRLFFLFSLFLTHIAAAQLLHWTPLFPTVEDTITITFDATQGSAGLVGANEVYAHTGVLTTGSVNSADWKYVIAGWSQNIPQAKMTALGNDRWQLKYHIRSFYDLPANEHVTSLAFVFRNADGSRTGKTTSGGDIFLPVYESGPHVQRLSPAAYHNILAEGDSLFLFAVGTGIDQFDLYIDNTLVQSANNDTLSRVIIPNPNDFAKHRLRLEAYAGAGLVQADSFYYLVRPPAPVAVLPAGTRDGINYGANGDITLVLPAPHKEYVYLLGDWNNWEADPNFYLYTTPDRSRFWTTITNPPANASLRYQYWVDGAIKIADPYAELVLDPWNDQSISAATFPNMPAYPVGKTTEIVSVLQTTQTSFQWQAANYQKPEKENLVIYELLLRDFLREHDYKTLTDTLDYFVKLGVNAIELMPISEFEGNSSWGYNPSFYFAPDKYYGPKADLQRFIDEAHKRNIAVIQDMVLNHSYGQSPMVRLYQDNPASSPWFNVQSPNPVFSWGYDFNHESAATREFVDRVTSFWLTEYRMDGFRFDFTKGFTNTPGDGGGRDESRIAILKRMADAIWAVDPAAYVILEHFADNSEERDLVAYGMLVWGNSNYNYNEATMGYFDSGKSDFSWGVYKNRGWGTPGLVTYMESHDEERLMFKNKAYGNSNGAYDIKVEKTALERMELAATFFLTIPGPKMLWQFIELGYDYSIDYNGRLGEKPIRWNYLNQANRKKLHDVFAALLRLRRDHAVFSTTNFVTSFAAPVKWLRLNHPVMNVVVAGNFDVIDQATDLAFQHTGWWYDYFSGDSVLVEGVRREINLAPGAYRLYTDVRFEQPLTRVENSPNGTPSFFQLHQNYPNPFNPNTTITFELPLAADVELGIYNARGQKIKNLLRGHKAAGLHQVVWDGRSDLGEAVAGGLYFYKIATAHWATTRRMVLLR